MSAHGESASEYTRGYVKINPDQVPSLMDKNLGIYERVEGFTEQRTEHKGPIEAYLASSIVETPEGFEIFL